MRSHRFNSRITDVIVDYGKQKHLFHYRQLHDYLWTQNECNAQQEEPHNLNNLNCERVALLIGLYTGWSKKLVHLFCTH